MEVGVRRAICRRRAVFGRERLAPRWEMADMPDGTQGRRDGEAEDLLAQLVGIESTAPGAYEGDVEAFVRGWLQDRIAAAPAARATLQEVEALPGRTCLRATIPATSGPAAGMVSGPSDLTLICHLDTVVVGAGWDDATPPFGAAVRGGSLYGRGACDMKGGLACAMLAFADALAEVQRDGALPRRSLSLVCTVDEEDLMRGVEACIRADWLGGTGWVLDTAPTAGLARGSHKGRTWFRLTMHGRTAHASTPWQGADAIAAMAEAVCRVRAAVGGLPSHPELGDSTVTFGRVEGGYSPYVVPDECTVTIDLRLAPPTGTQEAELLVRQAADEAERAVPGTRASLCCTGSRPPVELDPDSPLLAALGVASQEAWGERPGVGVFTGYTDSAVVAATCGNPTCLSYGPGSLEVAHKPNEHVPLEDLARVRAVLSRLAWDVLWG